jgi:hypothetical protein
MHYFVFRYRESSPLPTCTVTLAKQPKFGQWTVGDPQKPTWEEGGGGSETGSGDNGSEDELGEEGELRVPVCFLPGALCRQRAFCLGRVELVGPCPA